MSNLKLLSEIKLKGRKYISRKCKKGVYTPKQEDSEENQWTF